MGESERIGLEAIGHVVAPDTGQKERRREIVSKVVLKEEFAGALDGIEKYSHIFVIFYMDRIAPEARRELKVYPRGRMDLPFVGIFATRNPGRPNPIGLTVVEVLERSGNILTVKGLDALDGTPVLDIKPYDHYDVPEEFRVPDWWLRLLAERG